MTPDSPDRLARQIAFAVELDKLKAVLRRSVVTDATRRRENSAEHSWHVATLAVVLGEHANPDVDLNRVARMLLVHDVVEIDADDTFCYDAAGNATKADRERLAGDRIFGLLPTEQGAELTALWREFDAATTPDAVFANALDRLQPLLQNYHTQGKSWREHGVTADQVFARADVVRAASPTLWAYVQRLLTDAVAKGYLAPPR